MDKIDFIYIENINVYFTKVSTLIFQIHFVININIHIYICILNNKYTYFASQNMGEIIFYHHCRHVTDIFIK